MLPPEPTLKEKLLFIPRPMEQCCRAHLLPAVFFCSKPTCQMYTFLCDRCRRDNLHGHVDDIHDYGGWVERMSERAAKLRVTSQQRIFESVRGQAGKSLRRYVGELRRVFEVVEALEKQLCDLIRETKAKISGYIRKYEGFGENRLASRGHLYANPYLLAAKLSSERNDEFVQQLKQCLRGEAELVDGFNPKYEVINLQNRLKQVIDGNSTDVFIANKEVSKMPTIQSKQQRILLCENKPEKLFMRGDSLLIGLRNETQIYGLLNGALEDRLALGLSRCSSVGQDFIGINRDNNKELVTYIDRKLGSFTFEFRICSILLYSHKDKDYAIIGREEGKITIFDIQSSLIIATLQEAHNSKVDFLQPWEGQMKVLSCGKNTPISIYKILHLMNEVSLQFQQQLTIGVGQIRQFQVYGSFFVAILQGRNVLVYDLILKVQYLNTSMEICKDCDMISLLNDSQTHLFLGTHNQGENFICIWDVEKQKTDGIKCDRLQFLDKEEVGIMEMFGSDVWLIRPSQNERKLYNFNLAVI